MSTLLTVLVGHQGEAPPPRWRRAALWGRTAGIIVLAVLQAAACGTAESPCTADKWVTTATFGDRIGVSGQVRAFYPTLASAGWLATYENDDHAVVAHWDASVITFTATPTLTVENPWFFPNQAFQAFSSGDAWFVNAGQGPSDTLSNGPFAEPQVLHWGGVAWTTVPVRVTPGEGIWLHAIAGLSPDDIWAVGESTRTGDAIEHWDGSAWHEVLAPNAPGYLMSVAPVSADDVWAAGEGVLDHWNGSTWTVVPLVLPGLERVQRQSTYTEVYVASAGTSLWLYGNFFGPTGAQAYYHSFVALRTRGGWDVTWRSPGPGIENAVEIAGFVPTAGGQAWMLALVNRYLSIKALPQELVHWDGHTWSAIPFPADQDPGPQSVMATGSDPSGVLSLLGRNRSGTYVARYVCGP